MSVSSAQVATLSLFFTTPNLWVSLYIFKLFTFVSFLLPSWEIAFFYTSVAPFAGPNKYFHVKYTEELWNNRITDKAAGRSVWQERQEGNLVEGEGQVTGV